MPEEKPKEGSLVHVELLTKEPERTKAFYKEVFGWTFQDMPEMNYIMFETPGPPSGGLRKPEEAETPGTLNYLLVDSIDASLTKVERSGGKILIPKQAVGTRGWLAIIRAPGDVVQGLWEQGPQP